MSWAKKFKCDYCFFDIDNGMTDPFFNINTPDDLEKAKYRLEKGIL